MMMMMMMHVALSEEVTCAQPNELGPISIQPKTVWRHPDFDLVDGSHGTASRTSRLWDCAGPMELRFIRIQMDTEPERFYQLLDVSGVEDVEGSPSTDPWATPERTTAHCETDPQ